MDGIGWLGMVFMFIKGINWLFWNVYTPFLQEFDFIHFWSDAV